MSKEKKEEFMRFGQIIRIHGHRLADAKSNKRGMIVAKGFTDPDAKYMTFNTFQFCEFYRQSLFQVLPKGIFETPGPKLSDEEVKKLEENYEVLIKQYKVNNVGGWEISSNLAKMWCLSTLIPNNTFRVQ